MLSHALVMRGAFIRFAHRSSCLTHQHAPLDVRLFSFEKVELHLTRRCRLL